MRDRFMLDHFMLFWSDFAICRQIDMYLIAKFNNNACTKMNRYTLNLFLNYKLDLVTSPALCQEDYL